MVPQGVFLCVGGPILDVIATVDDEFIRKYDVQMDTSSLAEERHIHLFPELVNDWEPQYVASGAAQNTVRVAQWMMGLPGVTSFMGCIARDDYGDTLKHCISADGVNVHFMEAPAGEATGTVATLLSASGQRALVANLASANKFSVEHLATEKAAALIAAAKFIYMPGFFLTENLDSLLFVARRAVDEDKTFLLNLSATYIVQFYMDNVMAAMPYCDFLFCNDSEALAFGAMKGWGADVPLIALRIASLPKASGTRPRVVVVTQGGGETVVSNMGKVAMYPVTKLENELMVDINGAGDSFVGGFVSKLILGENLGNCVRAGHWVARTVIQQHGCSLPKVCDFV